MRAALLSVVLLGCPAITAIDAGPQTLRLEGRVCAREASAFHFPVKVVVLFDQSGSMCVTDPPGSQSSPGLCESAVPDAGGTEPARIRALRALLEQFSGNSTQVALVPFATNPSLLAGEGSPVYLSHFLGAKSSRLLALVSALPSQLGGASDLQGALETANSLLSYEAGYETQIRSGRLPQTRYIVLVVSDGPPSPRCAANDSLDSYADDAHPGLPWPDSSGYCNSAVLGDVGGINNFVGGQDRNQDAQLFGVIDQLNSLEQRFGVGDVRVHTVLMFNEEAVNACGPICQDSYGPFQRWPGPVAVPSSQNAAFARAEGARLLRELASRGHGSFSEFLNATDISAMSFQQFDYAPLAAPGALRRFVVQPLRAVESEGAWVADSDGDGASDDEELAAGTDPHLGDTDADGFDDRFELGRRADGFDPLVWDQRGCLSPGCFLRDSDGDDLSDVAEMYLRTRSFDTDSDDDGFPDGLEVRAGTSPHEALSESTDTDEDGLTDAEELLRGSDPQHADRAFSDELGIETTISEEVPPLPAQSSSACYLFTSRNLPMVATTGAGEIPPGLGKFRLWFVSAPPLIEGDVGEWRSACAWARKDGAVRIPSELVLSVPEPWFEWPSSQWNPTSETCAGGEALAP
ncbi:MAG: VWA domain-containing protein [Archangium sp.]|nr:VWA domain-containing protein [Archangium sp.]